MQAQSFCFAAIDFNGLEPLASAHKFYEYSLKLIVLFVLVSCSISHLSMLLSSDCRTHYGLDFVSSVNVQALQAPSRLQIDHVNPIWIKIKYITREF